MERDQKLRSALTRLERIEQDPDQRRFHDQVARFNAVADWETHLEPQTTDTLENFFSTILFCDKHQLPLPSWARDFAKRPDDFIHVLTKKPGTRGGRHSNPLIARKEQLRAQYIAAAVKLAGLKSKRGDEKITAACDMLARIGYRCGFETVRRARGKARTVADFYVLSLKKLLLRDQKLS